MSIIVIPDPDRPEGGHAIIRASTDVATPGPVSFQISGLDGVDAGEDDWPHGLRSPLSVSRHDAGLDLAIGPDIVMGIPEGTPVEISIPELGLLSEMRWPALPLMRARRRGGGAMAAPRQALATGPVERQPAAPEPKPATPAPAMSQPRRVEVLATPDPTPRRRFAALGLAAAAGCAGGVLLAWSTVAVWHKPPPPPARDETKPAQEKPAAPVVGSAVYDALKTGSASPDGQSAVDVEAAEAYRRAIAARIAGRVGGGPESLFWLKRTLLTSLGGEQRFALHAVALSILSDPLSAESLRPAALALWQVGAAAGSQIALCNLAQSYRLGLGTEKSESHAAQFEALAGPAACAGLKSVTIPPREDKR